MKPPRTKTTARFGLFHRSSKSMLLWSSMAVLFSRVACSAPASASHSTTTTTTTTTDNNNNNRFQCCMRPIIASIDSVGTRDWTRTGDSNPPNGGAGARQCQRSPLRERVLPLLKRSLPFLRPTYPPAVPETAHREKDKSPDRGAFFRDLRRPSRNRARKGGETSASRSSSDPSAVSASGRGSGSRGGRNLSPRSLVLPPVLVSPLRRLFRDPRRLTEVGVNTALFLCVSVLIRGVWIAIAELAEEIAREDEYDYNSNDFDEDEAWDGHSVLRAVDFLRALDRSAEGEVPSTEEAMRAHRDRLHAAPSPMDQGAFPLPPQPPWPPSLSLILSARKLLAAGLSSARWSKTQQVHRPSVESVLVRLTPSEVAWLERCLWTPPEGRVRSSLWNSIVGLDHVKEGLMQCLLHGVGILPGDHDDDPHQQTSFRPMHPSEQDPFASLFFHWSWSSTSRNSNGNGNKKRGILMDGPPGCGKTMLVQALAAACRVPCLIISPSVLLGAAGGGDGGERSRNRGWKTRTLLSLVQKLAPCIVLLDELECVFPKEIDSVEDGHDGHEAIRQFRAQFLTWWDGTDSRGSDRTLELAPSSESGILVFGASNRALEVDPAILHRLGSNQLHHVGRPDAQARSEHLRRLLDTIPTDGSVDVHRIAAMTSGYSPMDLRQLLQTAALMGPMLRQRRRQQQDKENQRTANATAKDCGNGLTTDDIVRALPHSPPSPMTQQFNAAVDEMILQRQAANDAVETTRAYDRPSEANGGNGNAGRDEKNEGGKWETDWGNFYNLGTVEAADQETFDWIYFIVRSVLQSDSDSDDDDDDDENFD